MTQPPLAPSTSTGPCTGAQAQPAPRTPEARAVAGVPTARSMAARITAIYAAVASVWVLFSDWISTGLAHSVQQLILLQTLKGAVFVVATSALLYALVRGYVGRLTSLAARARISEERVRHVIESVPDLLYSRELPDLRVTFISSNVTAALGFEPEDFMDDPHLWYDQLHEADRDRVTAEIREQLEFKGAFTVEYRLWHRDGVTARWFCDNGRLEAAGASCCFGVLTDITDRKEAESALHYLTNHDPLTGLLNQHGVGLILDNLLQIARRRNTSLSCLCLGIDRFSHLNDAFGHKAVDEILVRVGQHLREELRASDVISRVPDGILARAGGGRFLVVLPDTGIDGARALAERALRGLDRVVVHYGEEQIRIGARVGIVGLAAHGSDAARLLSQAENALHRARGSAGGPVHVYDVREETEDALSARWLDRIHAALDKRRFVLHFQPILHLPSGGVHYYEVLVRMREPDGTLVSPTKFIHVAEHFGVIDRIDYQVLEMAIDYLRRLGGARPDIRLAVNLSGAHVGDTRLLAWLRKRLEAEAVDGARLIFEITETAAVEDLQQARVLMDSLRALGCRFALDDFGIGFTSFVHLRALPVDLIKIDGSFIRDL
ncbi:MAG TPA: EAL domain-containing protein, partial [Chromatiales bacterium]|nr:EAL domain-containing protein [Chromatiales bacterium]